MKKILAIILILVFSHLKSYAQTDSDYKIRFIDLSIGQAQMIPYQEVTIKIKNIRNKIEVKVKSDTSDKSEKWDYSRINKTFDMSVEDFLEIKNSLEKIELKNIFKGMEYSYKDGYGIGLSYGGFGGTVSLKFRSPTNRTQERGLEDCLKACILILEKGGLEDSLIKEILHIEHL